MLEQDYINQLPPDRKRFFEAPSRFETYLGLIGTGSLSHDEYRWIRQWINNPQVAASSKVALLESLRHYKPRVDEKFLKNWITRCSVELTGKQQQIVSSLSRVSLVDFVNINGTLRPKYEVQSPKGSFCYTVVINEIKGSFILYALEP